MVTYANVKAQNDEPHRPAKNPPGKVYAHLPRQQHGADHYDHEAAESPAIPEPVVTASIEICVGRLLIFHFAY
jgi:hypothetical protein